MTSATTYSITITGMQLKNIFCYPKFFWYASAALSAAQKAPGNIHASTNQYNLPNDQNEIRDTLMTLTVWEDRKSTLNYVFKSPAHVAAMKQMKHLGSYSKTYHYESTTIPTWEDAKELWLQHSKDYGTTTKRTDTEISHEQSMTKANQHDTEPTPESSLVISEHLLR